MNLELAAVARAGIDFADRETFAEALPGGASDRLRQFPDRGLVRRRRRLGERALQQALKEQFSHRALLKHDPDPKGRVSTKWTPVFRIDHAQTLEVMSGIGTVEGFVAEGKIRDDVTFDRGLEQRPLEPRGIAQVATVDAAVPQAKPDQNVAAEPLDDRHAFARLHSVRRFGSQWPFGKPVHDLANQGKRLLDFAHADPDARVDVALVEDRYLEAQAVVRRIDERPPRVERSAGRAADIAAG